MIVVMEPDASDAAIESVISFLVSAGFDVHRSSGQSRSILGVVKGQQEDPALNTLLPQPRYRLRKVPQMCISQGLANHERVRGQHVVLQAAEKRMSVLADFIVVQLR